MATSDCFKFKGVILIVLLHVGPLSGYIVDTGQCGCLPYSKPCIKEAVLISAASTFSNRILACLPGMRLCCDAETSQAGRSEQLGLTDQIRGFVLQMPNVLRRNRTRSPNAGNSGSKGRSQRVAYNPLLDGIKVMNSQESELGTTVGTTSADIREDKEHKFLTGVDANPNDNAENGGTSSMNPDIRYKVVAGIDDSTVTVTDFENLITLLPMPSEIEYESNHKSSDGYDLLDTRNSTHAEISVPVREMSPNNGGLQKMNHSSNVFSSDHYESTKEKGYLITTSVYSTQVGASNEKASNTNTVVDTQDMTSSHNSEINDNYVMSTFNYNLLETDRILGNQKTEEAVEKTLATLGELSIGKEANTVSVTSFNIITSSSVPSREIDMITKVSSVPIEYLVSPSLLSLNLYKPSSPAVEPVTPITKEGHESASPFTMSSIDTSKSSYTEYPTNLISNVIDINKGSPGPFIPENFLKGKEAAPVISASENVVVLVSDIFDIEDNSTEIIDSTRLAPKYQTIPLDPFGITNISVVQDSAGLSENKKISTVELLDAGMPSLATKLQNVNARNFTDLEGSIQAVPVQNSYLNGVDLALSQTYLLSSPSPVDERHPSSIVNNTLVEMVTEDRYKANLDSSGYRDLTPQIGITLNSKGTLPPTALGPTLLTGINTFAPGDYSKGSKSLPSEFRKFLLPNTELAIVENNVKFTTTKTYYIILRPVATSSLEPTTVKKETAKLTPIPHGSRESDGTYQPKLVTPSSDSQEQFNDYLKSVREEANKSNQGKNKGYFDWIFG